MEVGVFQLESNSQDLQACVLVGVGLKSGVRWHFMVGYMGNRDNRAFLVRSSILSGSKMGFLSWEIGFVEAFQMLNYKK